MSLKYNIENSVECRKVLGESAIQLSDAWFEWRTKFRTASQASTVLGLNPFETAEEMKKKELGETPWTKPTKAMQEGISRENEVKQKAEEHFKKSFTPECWEYGKYGASLDGIDESGKVVVELKVSYYTYFQLKKGVIPQNYKIQVMQQLLCSGAEVGYIVAMNPETADIQISDAIKLEEDFFLTLENAWLEYENLSTSV